MQSRLCPGAAGSIVSGLKQQRQVLGAAGPGPQRHRVVAHLLHSCLLCYVLKIDCGCVALGFCAPINVDSLLPSVLCHAADSEYGVLTTMQDNMVCVCTRGWTCVGVCHGHSRAQSVQAASLLLCGAFALQRTL